MWRERAGPGRACVLLAALAGLLHLALVAARFGGSPFASTEPVLDRDYSIHFANAVDTCALLRAGGRVRGFDPYHLAGWPHGVYLEAGNHVPTLAVCLAGGRLGPGRAFNLAIFLMLAAPPFLVAWGARMLGLAHAPLALLFVALFQHLDPLPWGLTRYGLIGFVLGSALAVLAAGAALRLAEEPGLARGAALALALAALFFAHPSGALAALVPVGAGALAAAVRRDRRAILGFAAALVVALALNLIWLAPLLGAGAYKTGSDVYLRSSAWRALLDYLWLPDMGPRKAVVLLALVGLAGLARPWPLGVRVAAAGFLASGVLGYLGSRLGPLAQLEPGRFLLPMAGFAATLAPSGLLRLVEQRRRRWPWAAALLVGAAPALLNSAPAMPPVERLSGRFNFGLLPDERELVDWARARQGSGRILLDHPPNHGEGASRTELGSILPLYSRREFLAAHLPSVALIHASTILREGRLEGRALEHWPDPELLAWLERYGVRWVLATSAAARERFARLPGAVPAGVPGGRAAFELGEVSPFLAGAGTVQAELDRIVVRPAAAGRLVLRYRYLETLAASAPGVRLSRDTSTPDPVGFIALDVPAGLRREIVLTSAGWP